jgi:hypothetical protein
MNLGGSEKSIGIVTVLVPQIKKELGIWFCFLFYQNKSKNSDYCS